MRPVCGGSAPGGRRWRGSLELEGAGDARRCRLLRAAWAVAGLVALLAVLVAVDAHADRRRQWTTYGSARGRLVVACDMRSDTCSDRRKITTTRATPVPCEVAPGVWEMVGVDEGCYSVRGLESWRENTSYLSYGAELDRSPWLVTDGATRVKQDGFYRITGTTNNSRVQQQLATPEEGVWTFSCIMRTAGSPNARLRLYSSVGSGGGFCNLDSSDEFSTYSCTQTGTITSVHVYSGIGHIDVQGCWLTKTSTPGRPCWGGEAPVTCDGERNSISTDGWPTESGEISVTFRAGPPTSGDNAIIESRDGGTILFSLRRRASDGRISLITSGPTLDGASVEVGDTAHVRVVRDGSTVSLWVNGVKSAESGGMPAWVWSSTAVLGRNPAGPSLPLNGSISSIRIRSTP